jgi:hypothetical protein
MLRSREPLNSTVEFATRRQNGQRDAKEKEWTSRQMVPRCRG